MANKRISELSAANPLSGSDLLEVAQDNGDGSFTSTKATVKTISDHVTGSVNYGTSTYWWNDGVLNANGTISGSALTAGVIEGTSLTVTSASFSKFFPGVTASITGSTTAQQLAEVIGYMQRIGFLS